MSTFKRTYFDCTGLVDLDRQSAHKLSKPKTTQMKTAGFKACKSREEWLAYLKAIHRFDSRPSAEIRAEIEAEDRARRKFREDFPVYKTRQ